jgi:hypothetical protein
LSGAVEEKALANATKMCYTYDELSRVTSCTAMSLCGEVLHTECFTYDAASNVTDCVTDCSMQYDAQNRLTVYDDYAMAIVVTVVAVMAVANTVITAGAAFADDIAAIGAAISAWGRAFGLC